MISHRHRCIYVKLPRCASTSVHDWFLAHGAGRYTHRPSWYPHPLEHRIVPTAAAVALYPGYLTFTFLRNPYRRLLSLHGHALRLARAGYRGQPRGYGSLRDFVDLCGEVLADTRGLWGADALAFRAEHAGRRYGPLGIRLRELRFLVCHARPQVDFLPDCNPERLFGVARATSAPLGFAGAVETLDADFARLQAALGLPRLPLPRKNASAPGSGACETLRRDPALRRAIETIYAEDFAFAGYPVGDPDGRAAGLPRPAQGPVRPPAAGGRPSPAVRARRARLTLAAAEIAVEARIVRAPPVRRLLAPLSRLRRKLARSDR